MNRINVRALPSDFVRWNISNWTAEEMMPYFNRMESYDNFVNANNSMLYSNTTQIRGENGPLKTVYSGSGILPMDPVAKSFIDASIAAGYPLSSIGFNGPDGEARVGVGYYEFNIRNGLRDSVASALLGNEGNGYTVPSNLVIESNATVLKVLFDDSSYSKPRAVGVKFFSGRTNEIIRARLKNNSHLENSHRQNEVILAAGAIMSPQILSNSKIRGGGRRSNLTHVGKNLQDHPVVAVSFEEDKALQKSVRTYVEATNAVPSYIESIESEKLNQVGVLGSPGFSAGGFLASPWSEDKEPDIQLTVFPRAEEPHYSNQVANDRQSIVKNILVTVALLRPEGRYQINFAQSSESFRLPTIVPKDNVSLLTDLDAKRLAWGIEQVRQIQKNAPLSNDTGKEVYPGSQIRDEELIRFVKRSKMTNSHWCGSTRMGTDTSNSVVDKRLRVHGVEGLRVVDAGVMPFIPNGNTHSTTCAVALRGVDLIFG
jgi:choline dehydrogenase-like flavoprotein